MTAMIRLGVMMPATAALLVGAWTGCSRGGPTLGDDAMALQVTSTAFEHESDIPAQFTCEGDDVAPPLAWTAGPDGTRSYALIMDDPDAPGGTWVHWVAWNIKRTSLPAAAAEGMNSWKRTGYGGPCPPSGTHRYYFKVYALDAELSLDATTTKGELLRAMEGHILAQGQLMGRYRRAGR